MKFGFGKFRDFKIYTEIEESSSYHRKVSPLPMCEQNSDNLVLS